VGGRAAPDQVEHNTRERYGWWRLRQSLWLARRTERIIGVSQRGARRAGGARPPRRARAPWCSTASI
jgi:hypothetical protein